MNTLFPSPEAISLWHEKPGLQGIESLIADILPQAVELAGGICEVHGHSLDLVLPDGIQKDWGTATQNRVTPFTSSADASLPHIGLAHPLVLDFVDRVLESAPIDIIELTPFLKETPPQRVIEKLSSLLTFRPSKIEFIKQERIRRIWTHSVYWFGFEAADLGNRLKHFLQDSDGHFLATAEDRLKRLSLRSGEFEIYRHVQIPSELAATIETTVSEQLFEGEFKTEIGRLQGEELHKAINYYDRLEGDLRERMTQDIERGRKLPAIEAFEGKITRVQAERDIRLRNIHDRFRAQFKIEPVGARFLILPTFRIWIQPQASSEASISIDYCPVLREFLQIFCPSCGSATRDLILKGSGYLCPRCR